MSVLPPSFQRPFIKMPFLFKQPSVLPCILCASQCLPHDVLHDQIEYPSFYDPLYSPVDHTTLFDSEQSVCQWLQHGLVVHRVECSRCSQTTSFFSEMICRACFSSNFFEIEFLQLHFRVPISYIESSTFSFCGLYRHLLTFTDINHSSLLVHYHPLWLQTMSEEFLTCLSVISLSHLNDAMCLLKRLKTAAMEAIVNDVLQERAQFTSRDMTCSILLPLLCCHAS